jgi:hypothetical protein
VGESGVLNGAAMLAQVLFQMNKTLDILRAVDENMLLFKRFYEFCY